MIMTKHEPATGISATVSLQPTSGHLSDGSPPGHRADDCKAVSGEIEPGARRDHADDEDERSRKTGREPAGDENGRDDEDR